LAGQPFAILSHGLILNLYLARLTGEDPAALWQSIALPDLAIVDPERRAVVRPFGAWRADSSRTGAQSAKNTTR
jgi:hypothetical protein